MQSPSPCLIGRRLVPDLANPRPEDVDLDFMEYRLERIRRFSDHPLALSVNQHQLLTAHIARLCNAQPAVTRWCEVHDAHEYALGDIIAPLKRHVAAPLARLEEAWDWAIATALRIPPPSAMVTSAVHPYDMAARQMEWVWCMGRNPEDLGDPPSIIVRNLFPTEAEAGRVLTGALGEALAYAHFDARRRWADAGGDAL